MSTIRNFNNRIQSVNFKEVVALSMNQTKDEMVKFNQDDLSVSLLSTSTPITPRYKSGAYAKNKFALNPSAGLGSPDLKLTGSFYRGIYVTVDLASYSFTLNSTDSKSTQLELRYTPKIFGLTYDSKSIYALQTLRPVLNANLRIAIGI